jgi:hypothetical protein
MIKYGVSTLIRLVCIIIAFVVPLGWWTILPVIGAVFLPFFAVVVANVGHDGVGRDVERPGGIEVYRPQNAYNPNDFQGETFRTAPAQPGTARPQGTQPGAARPQGSQPQTPHPETGR